MYIAPHLWKFFEDPGTKTFCGLRKKKVLVTTKCPSEHEHNVLQVRVRDTRHRQAVSHVYYKGV